MEELKKYGMDIFLLCIGLIEKVGERDEKYVIDSGATIMNGIYEALKPYIRVLIPIHYRNDSCDFRFINVDEFCGEKLNVAYAKGSEVDFTPASLTGIPQILVLHPAL